MPKDIVVNSDHDEIVLNPRVAPNSEGVRLVKYGPRVDVLIGSPESLTPTVAAQLLIATGTSGTVLLSKVVEHLNLPVLGEVDVTVYGESTATHTKCKAQIQIPLRNSAKQELLISLPVVSVPEIPAAPNAAGLLGRDVLHYLRFVYDGPSQDFWFELPGLLV